MNPAARESERAHVAEPATASMQMPYSSVRTLPEDAGRAKALEEVANMAEIYCRLPLYSKWQVRSAVGHVTHSELYRNWCCLSQWSLVITARY